MPKVARTYRLDRVTISLIEALARDQRVPQSTIISRAVDALNAAHMTPSPAAALDPPKQPKGLSRIIPLFARRQPRGYDLNGDPLP
jgi:hypothetical protein